MVLRRSLTDTTNLEPRKHFLSFRSLTFLDSDCASLQAF